MNEIQRDIRATITKLKAYEKGVVDAKWRNKIIARLEEVEVLAGVLMNQVHPSNQPMPDPDPFRQPPGCICPEGAISTDCPIHAMDAILF